MMEARLLQFPAAQKRTSLSLLVFFQCGFRFLRSDPRDIFSGLEFWRHEIRMIAI